LTYTHPIQVAATTTSGANQHVASGASPQADSEVHRQFFGEVIIAVALCAIATHVAAIQLEYPIKTNVFLADLGTETAVVGDDIFAKGVLIFSRVDIGVNRCIVLPFNVAMFNLAIAQAIKNCPEHWLTHRSTEVPNMRCGNAVSCHAHGWAIS
jgi:hypothetical protein